MGYVLSKEDLHEKAGGVILMLYRFQRKTFVCVQFFALSYQNQEISTSIISFCCIKIFRGKVISH